MQPTSSVLVIGQSDEDQPVEVMTFCGIDFYRKVVLISRRITADSSLVYLINDRIRARIFFLTFDDMPAALHRLVGCCIGWIGYGTLAPWFDCGSAVRPSVYTVL